jgi:hypothetical protein
MGGAAVFSDAVLVGMITQHRKQEGPGVLTATRIDRWYDKLSQEDIAQLHELIGLPLSPDDLTPV